MTEAAAPDQRGDHSEEPPPAGYRPCVGLMLLNSANLVFIGERRGPLLNAWQMPQGGIDLGETPRAAAWRELKEEVGTDHAQLLAESRHWHSYDLPPELRPARWDARHRGQSQRWFAFRFTGEDAEIDLEAHEPEFARWRWARPAEVLNLVVAFKRPVYEAVLTEFAPLLR
jgi:putative (di)nucleoside polyphosphate hydrolase